MLKENFSRFILDGIYANRQLNAFSNYEASPITYADVEGRIYHLHLLFDSLGIKRGDKIAFLGKNSTQWAVAYMACITYGATLVPIMPNFAANDVHHIINHSETDYLFANLNLWENLEIEKMFVLKACISLDDFTELFAKTEKISKKIAAYQPNKYLGIEAGKFNPAEVPNDAIYAIIYTSETTGFSKGVVLTHNNITANMVYARKHMPLVAGDPILSFLPLAHAYGCAIELLYPFTLGCHITFLGKTPTPQILIKAFKEIRPRLILSVPLILEKIYKKQIKPAIDKPLVKILLNIPFMEKSILKKVNKKLTDTFGGNFHEVVIGGAALNEEVQTFLNKAGFAITIGYGMTECAPLISYDGWKTNKLGSAGKVVDSLEMKIDSDDPQKIVGEIMVRGENVMKGYYKNPEATAETIMEDGWMRTGDLGIIDKDGYLFIRGRSKNMILGPSGQNIYPEELESFINNWDYVQESLVVERKDVLVAMIYPDFDAADSNHLSERQLAELYESKRKALNKEVASYMQIAKIQIVPNEFEKTPKRSIKRFMYSNSE